jgi:hypothetical protein
MDLGKAVEKAVSAARRGDLEALEIALAQLRTMPAESVVGLNTRLRAMVASVRSHPSYRAVPQAQAV